MARTWLTLFVALTLYLLYLGNLSVADDLKCIEGVYHKTKPSKETSEYQQCHSYKDLTCCTAKFTSDLAANRTKNLYNHTWDHCGNLSTTCLNFWITQECFYQCSPFVSPWEDPGFPGGLKGVPVCGSFCDEWFEACKDDFICVDNVLSDFDFGEFGHNHCPKVNNQKQCKTYKERYMDGRGLCQKMWGDSYTYTVENKQKSNCFQMDFAGENPNNKVPKPNMNTKGGSTSVIPSVFMLSLLFIFSLM